MLRKRTTWLTATTAAAAAVLLVAIPSTAAGAAASAASCATSTASWVASWTASPTDSFPLFDPLLKLTPAKLTNQTVRMVIAPHLGGSSLRIHLSNRFATAPLRVGAATIGVQGSGSSLTKAPTPVTFGGARAATIPAGQDLISDPVNFTFTSLEPLSVSVFLPEAKSPVTEHWNANATNYYTPTGTGNATGQVAGTAFTKTTASWLYIDGLDVKAKATAIVAFGDSITDGFVGGSIVSIPVNASIANKNGRYPDDLQRRINAAGLPISVVNQGIGSNQVIGTLGLFTGPSGLSRFQADALEVPGVRGVLVLEGINDLGLGHQITPDQLEAAYTQLIQQAHAAGKKIWLGTITPAANSITDGVLLRPKSDTYRQEINKWIRQQHLADGVVDFDAALRDPAHPSRLLPAYSGVDHLHPSLAGYQKMAQTVPLSLLTEACR